VLGENIDQTANFAHSTINYQTTFEKTKNHKITKMLCLQLRQQIL